MQGTEPVGVFNSAYVLKWDFSFKAHLSLALGCTADLCFSLK